jgi:creatinine amidohydrolase/Fe(II)-dependent formamide hydrolase-like protein
MMLYIDPGSVEMVKASKDYDTTSSGPLTRTVGEPGKSFSGSGVWGDATLATEKKGRLIVEATVAGLLSDIAKLRQVKSPAASSKLP